MPVDPYAPCPCGSGKKFKWCCQPFYDRIEKAFQHQANGQHETALRTMDELSREFPSSAEVWGKRAELLWENNRLEDAEQSVAKALEINPAYAFGYLLQGMFRHDAQDIAAALPLYRKAAQVCNPDERELLSEIYGSVGQCEMLMNRPLAAHAAWEISLRHLPSSETTQRYVQQYFGDQSPLPPIVRKEYAFKKPTAASGERQAAWEQALAGASTGRLGDAAQAFEQLTADDAKDAAAWYNLGLVRAWLGDNAGAIEAFDAYVANEPDEQQAAEAWALTEVLRLGDGMEERSDWVEHVATYPIQDIERLAQAITQDRRVVGLQEYQGLLGGALLNRPLPAADENLAGFQLPRVAAHLLLAGQGLRLMNTDGQMLDEGRGIIQEMCGPAIGEPRFDRVPPSFQRLLDEALSVRIPQGLKEDHAMRLVTEQLQKFFEETWSHRPLKSLNQIPPIDAAGHPVLRKKLLGLIRFLEEMAKTLPFPYDFDRLRHRLGLATAKPATAGTQDIAAMNAAELAAVEAENLSDEDLEKAFQSSLRLDARELAGRFARATVNRPPSAGKPDRYPFFNHLVQLSLDGGASAEAQSWIDAGLKQDCENNEGKRRNDYELRRAQIHLKANEPELARAAFDRVIQRVPSDLKILGMAAEAMLSSRLPQHAASYAEQGLAKAKQKGDRDHTGYFEELLAAAKRGVGW